MIIIKNSLDYLDKIFNMIYEKSKAYGISQDIQNDLCVCMDEVFLNIVKYAYDDTEDHEITIEFDFDEPGKKITITFTDDGKAFNPLEVNPPYLSSDLLEREIGGLGIFIVSNTMSRIKYNRLGNFNRLEMTKEVG